MSNSVIVITEHLNGQLDELSFELLGKGKSLAQSFGGSLTAVLLGHNHQDLISQLGIADQVYYADHPALVHFNPEAYVTCLAEMLKGTEARLILIPYSSMGMDIASALSIKLDLPLVSFALEIVAGEQTLVTSQLYGGKINVESAIEGNQAIVSVIAGAFPAEAGKQAGSPEVQEVSVSGLDALNIQFKHLIEPEAGDVDITQAEVLVSVGRGIQKEDNLPLVQALADALGGALSCSRPIVDSKWLPKTRQVGKSGLKVKPKLYLAVGISGAPEHIEGMKEAELIIAINADPKAPIFDYAHYGITEDLFEIVPALTEKL